jgi:hypothetical protein
LYSVDDRDHVVELELPQMDPGATTPEVAAEDLAVTLTYRGLDGGRIVCEFELPIAHYLGPPNDEAFEGHPLYERGLEPYGVFEVLESSWIRRLEEMNRIHDRHDPSWFRTFRHFVFAFHDSTFEVIARGMTSEPTAAAGHGT